MIFDRFCYELSWTMQAIFNKTGLISSLDPSRSVYWIYCNVVGLQDANVLDRRCGNGIGVKRFILNISWYPIYDLIREFGLTNQMEYLQSLLPRINEIC